MKTEGGWRGGVLNYSSWINIQWNIWISHTLGSLCSCGWIERVVFTYDLIISATVYCKWAAKDLGRYCIQQFDRNGWNAYWLSEVVSRGYNNNNNNNNRRRQWTIIIIGMLIFNDHLPLKGMIEIGYYHKKCYEVRLWWSPFQYILFLGVYHQMSTLW